MKFNKYITNIYKFQICFLKLLKLTNKICHSFNYESSTFNTQNVRNCAMHAI